MERYYIAHIIRKHGTISTKADCRIPNTFCQYSYKENGKPRIFLVCRQSINNQKCDFAVRKDQYLDDKERFNNHQCKPFTDKTIDFESSLEITPIEEATINFFGKNQLPFNLITKPSFHEFAESLISLGQKNPTADPKKLYPIKSRQTFTKHFIHYSELRFQKKLDAYKKQPGSCLTVDSGKHKSIQYLMIILANARIEAKPLIIDCIRYFGGKQGNYKNDIEKVLTKLFKDKVKVTAIVSDNLRCQVSAINHRNKKSMQQTTTNPKVAQTIWLSCACHSLTLSFKDAAKDSDFGELVNNIIETSAFLRSKNISNLIHMRCPSGCKSRWTGIFDISFWMLKNFDKIYEKIINSLKNEIAYDFPDSILRGMTKTATTLFVILLPFKNATHVLEADNMPACYVTPIINQSLKLLEENAQFVDVSENIIDSIKEKVFERMIYSQSGAYWNFLFSLTPLGRKQLREYPGISEHGTDPIIKPPESLILKEKESQKIIFEKIKQDSNFFTDKGEDLINEFNNFRGKLVNFKNSKVMKQHNSTESTSELAEVDIDPISLNLLNDESTKDDAECDFSDDYSEYEMSDSDDDENETEENPDNNTSEVDIDSSYGPLATNISVLKEIAQTKGYTPEEITLFVTRYTDWITDDTNLLVMHDETLLMGIKCWRYIEYLPYMKSFAKFVIPLLGITSSESHCERAFWKQRRILGDQCTQTSIKVEKARLNYSTNE